MKIIYQAKVCALVALTAISFALTACQGGGGNNRGGMEFIIANGTEIQSLDHSRITGVPEHRVHMALFEGLVRYDPRTSAPLPALAERWTMSEDYTVLTFYMRRNVTWSDGVPINAHTIVESWLYLLSPETAFPYANSVGEVIKGAADYTFRGASPESVGIRAIDDYTLQVDIIGDFAYAVDTMAHFSYSPLPLHVIRRHGTEWTRPENFVGNGPFVLQEWRPNDRLVVVPNEKYWDKDNVHLTRITFLPIEDSNTAFQAFRNGEIDWSTNPPVALLDELRLRQDFQVHVLNGTYFLYLNNEHAVLNDRRVRQALSMVINRRELVDRIVRGGEVPAYGAVPPMGNYQAMSGDEHFNIERAQALLAEAGFPNGQGIPTLSFMYNTLDLHRVIGEYLQQVWREHLGINISLQNLEWTTFLQERSTSRMEIARAGWVLSVPNPTGMLQIFVSDDPQNHGRYNNAEFDRLVNQARGMLNSPERTLLMQRAEEILIRQDQGVIPLFFYVSQNLIDLNRWSGWYANAEDIHPWVGVRRR